MKEIYKKQCYGTMENTNYCKKQKNKRNYNNININI